jgi:hypothetical protein
MKGIRRGCHSLIAILTVAVPVVCAGCGRTEGLYPASGKVLYHGKPAVGATVFFHRLGGPGPAPEVIPTGVVGEDGSFRVSSDVTDGAPAGQYHVLIAWQDRSVATSQVPAVSPSAPGKGSRKAARTASRIRPSPSLPPDRLKGRYLDPDHPLLTVEIKPGSNSLAPFELSE